MEQNQGLFWTNKVMKHKLYVVVKVVVKRFHFSDIILFGSCLLSWIIVFCLDDATAALLQLFMKTGSKNIWLDNIFKRSSTLLFLFLHKWTTPEGKFCLCSKNEFQISWIYLRRDFSTSGLSSFWWLDWQRYNEGGRATQSQYWLNYDKLWCGLIMYTRTLNQMRSSSLTS